MDGDILEVFQVNQLFSPPKLLIQIVASSKAMKQIRQDGEAKKKGGGQTLYWF